MSRIEHTIVINRPIDSVFRFVHEPRNDPIWQAMLIESAQVGDGPVGVGTQVRERRRFLGVQVEMTKEITEYEPSRRSAFTYVAGGAPMSGAVEDLAGTPGTLLTCLGCLCCRRLRVPVAASPGSPASPWPPPGSSR